MAGIFLSYSRADRPIAQGIAEALTAEGFTVWWDKVLRAGETYDEVTERMLRESSVVVVLWSQTSVKSKWVRAEATLGQRNATVIPAMIEDADRPIMFELTQTADLIGWTGDRTQPHWQDFVTDIRGVIDEETAVAEPAAPVAVAAPAPDATIENTYWMSIKDTSDPAELDSYLKRYPEGHFSDLARSRMAALSAPAAAAAVLPPPQPAPPPTPQPAPSPPPPQPVDGETKSGSGSKLPLIIGGLVLLGGLGFGATMMMSGDAPQTEVLTTADTPPAPIPPAAPDSEDASEAAEVETPTPTPNCEICPDMVSIPTGSFTIGSPPTEAGRVGNEGPPVEMTIAAFEMSRSEITQAEWAHCVAGGGCNGLRNTGNDLPAFSLTWDDAASYASWLARETGRPYRLPSEAEWEYAARAGTTTAYWWGDVFGEGQIVTGSPSPAASGAENPFGMVGMLTNVREWVQDCYINNYTNVPVDGSAVTAGDCGLRVIRGGSFRHGASEHRAANRARVDRGTRDPAVGFRVVVSSDGS
ncbi:MAG: SUMF1/EgtB/PvdO family nonheme iron enzyme [Pseudomonadota bacterium]